MHHARFMGHGCQLHCSTWNNAVPRGITIHYGQTEAPPAHSDSASSRGLNEKGGPVFFDWAALLEIQV
jgi:hypothetical protein